MLAKNTLLNWLFKLSNLERDIVIKKKEVRLTKRQSIVSKKRGINNSSLNYILI